MYKRAFLMCPFFVGNRHQCKYDHWLMMMIIFNVEYFFVNVRIWIASYSSSFLGLPLDILTIHDQPDNR